MTFNAMKINKTKSERWYIGGIKQYKSTITISNNSRDTIYVHSWGKPQCDDLAKFLKKQLEAYYAND